MSAGMTIEVRGLKGSAERLSVEVLGETDLQARYDRLTALVLRVGDWLSGPQAQLLPPAEWEHHFARYQQHLEELRRLGDLLRPVSLREGFEPLAGDALIHEVMELFAG
jgi:hypothetical protein